jgi:hypothetical protein
MMFYDTTLNEILYAGDLEIAGISVKNLPAHIVSVEMTAMPELTDKQDCKKTDPKKIGDKWVIEWEVFEHSDEEWETIRARQEEIKKESLSFLGNNI